MLYIENYCIKGFTYPIKDDLRKLGCKWNPNLKVWMCTEENSNAVHKLIYQVNADQENKVREQWKIALNRHNLDKVVKGTADYDLVYNTFMKNISIV